MPDKNLVITSLGNEPSHLQRLAQGALSIRFVHCANREEFRFLVGNSISTIFIPMNEHFGITPVESMAAGKLVIGVAEGGLLETVIPAATGLLIPPDPDPMDLITAVQSLTPQRAQSMRADCEARATLFSKELFLEKMRTALANRVS